MLSRPQDCVFHDSNYCVHTDATCKKLCGEAMKHYSQLTFSEHLSIHDSRRQAKRESVRQWVSVVISILALGVSLVALVASARTVVWNDSQSAVSQSEDGEGSL